MNLNWSRSSIIAFKSAFTLIELLVVTAIIATLAGILAKDVKLELQQKAIR